MLKKLKRVWRCYFGPPMPTSTRQISNSTQRQLLTAAFPNAEIRLSGLEKRLCRMEDIRKFLDWDRTNEFRYEGKDDKYVCVNFAFRLLGQFSIPGWSDHCIGFIWTDRLHALNFFLDENMDFWFMEPQTDGLSKMRLLGETVGLGVM